MLDMRCFSIGGMKDQHDAFLESFGTTEEIIKSLNCLPPRTTSLPSSSLFSSYTLNPPLLIFFFLLSEVTLSKILI